MRRLSLCLFALLACAPEKPTPVDVVELVYNTGSNKYEPRKVKLKTVTDLVALQGAAAKMVGGTKFVIDDNDPALRQAGNDVNKIKDAITKNQGGDVKVGWIESDGALVPADFHSLNLVTAYYNIERAREVYDRIGNSLGPKFGQRVVYYFPEFTENGETLKDNAMFMPLLQSFLVLPFEEFQMVPFSINGGVVAHEFSHAVFNFRVFRGSPSPSVELQWMAEIPSSGANLLASLDEGLADLFGTAATCDDTFGACGAAFVGKSLPGDETVQRRIDVQHCVNPTHYKSMLEDPYSTFANNNGFQYRIGSVLSSALWKAAEDDQLIADAGNLAEARKQMLLAVSKAVGSRTDAGGRGIADLVSDYSGVQSNFRLDSSTGVNGVLDAFIDAADNVNLKRALCRTFLDYFHFTANQIRNCQNIQSLGSCQ
jgi:hypothetical protein